MNYCVLMGRLTKDPELRTTPNGKSVASFTIAVDHGYGEKKSANFINCIAWENRAEFVGKYFQKGSMIAVEGEITTRQYEKDGQKRTVTEILAKEIHFCGGKSEKPKESGGFEELDDMEGLPF